MKIRYIEPVDSDLFDQSRTVLLNNMAAPNTTVEVCHVSLPPELSGPMLPTVPLYLNEIVQEVLRAEEEGCDAAIIGCCSDPALPDAQRAANIPVVGPLQAAAATAAGRGLRLGILCPDEHAWKTTANWLRANLRHYGLSDVVGPIRFVSMRSPDDTEGIIGNTELKAADLSDRFRNKLHENAVPAANLMLEEDEVQAVLFGCTLWGGMISEVSETVDALCLDPVLTALRFAELQAGIEK